MRFELIDRVIEQDQQQLSAVRTVSAGEEYLADHFPGFPVMPGVMMLEAMVQAARRLASGLGGLADRPLVVAEVRNVRYGRMVQPGQTLHVQVTLRGRDGDRLEFAGTGRVDQDVAVQGRFTLEPLAAENEPWQ